jgi:hypothetical protein
MTAKSCNCKKYNSIAEAIFFIIYLGLNAAAVSIQLHSGDPAAFQRSRLAYRFAVNKPLPALFTTLVNI